MDHQAAGPSFFAAACSGALAGVLQQEAAPSSSPAAAPMPGINSADAAPEVSRHAANAAKVLQEDQKGKMAAVIDQQSSMVASYKLASKSSPILQLWTPATPTSLHRDALNQGI